MSTRFSAILPDLVTHDHEWDRGYRLHVHRDESSTMILVHREQVWPEKINDPEANHIRHQFTVDLNPDEVEWLVRQLNEARGIIDDRQALLDEIASLRANNGTDVVLQRMIDTVVRNTPVVEAAKKFVYTDCSCYQPNHASSCPELRALETLVRRVSEVGP